MNSFNGTWKDEASAIITVTEAENIATVKYNNGRGPFSGFELDLGTPVVNVYFSDGVQPSAGAQAGVMSIDSKTITWSNGTVWTRQ